MSDRLNFQSAGMVPPQFRKPRPVKLADKPCVVCGRSTAQAEEIDYACCRDAGR